MSEDLEKKLLLGPAYRIFHEELTRHMDATEMMFESDALPVELVREAAGRFHTIRGGAGFFKLTRLADIAGQLENALQSGTTTELSGKVSQLRALNEALREEVLRIPPPAPATTT